MWWLPQSGDLKPGVYQFLSHENSQFVADLTISDSQMEEIPPVKHGDSTSPWSDWSDWSGNFLVKIAGPSQTHTILRGKNGRSLPVHVPDSTPRFFRG